MGSAEVVWAAQRAVETGAGAAAAMVVGSAAAVGKRRTLPPSG